MRRWPARWPAIELYCSFDWMKAHAGQVSPLGGGLWDGGGASFINKGINGRWRDVLSARIDRASRALVLGTAQGNNGAIPRLGSVSPLADGQH